MRVRKLVFEGGQEMSGMTCDIYISDAKTGEPMCMSAVFPED